MATLNWDKVKDYTYNLGVFIYFIVGMIVISTISYILYTRFNKQVAALLVFMSLSMALYYYYVKWFVIGDTFEPPKSFCPDLMTLIGKKGNKQFICADKVGAYGRTSDVTDVTNIPEPTGTEPADGKIVKIDGGGYVMTPEWDKLTNPEDSTVATAFCDKLSGAGYSWINFCKHAF